MPKERSLQTANPHRYQCPERRGWKRSGARPVEFGKLLWATGIQREALRSEELFFLDDAAERIWNLVQERFLHAVQVVDWFHAAAHLETVAKAVLEEEVARKA